MMTMVVVVVMVMVVEVLFFYPKNVDLSGNEPLSALNLIAYKRLSSPIEATNEYIDLVIL